MRVKRGEKHTGKLGCSASVYSRRCTTTCLWSFENRVYEIRVEYSEECREKTVFSHGCASIILHNNIKIHKPEPLGSPRPSPSPLHASPVRQRLKITAKHHETPNIVLVNNCLRVFFAGVVFKRDVGGALRISRQFIVVVGNSLRCALVPNIKKKNSKKMLRMSTKDRLRITRDSERKPICWSESDTVSTKLVSRLCTWPAEGKP